MAIKAACFLNAGCKLYFLVRRQSVGWISHFSSSRSKMSEIPFTQTVKLLRQPPGTWGFYSGPVHLGQGGRLLEYQGFLSRKPIHTFSYSCFFWPLPADEECLGSWTNTWNKGPDWEEILLRDQDWGVDWEEIWLAGINLVVVSFSPGKSYFLLSHPLVSLDIG